MRFLATGIEESGDLSLMSGMPAGARNCGGPVGRKGWFGPDGAVGGAVAVSGGQSIVSVVLAVVSELLPT